MGGQITRRGLVAAAGAMAAIGVAQESAAKTISTRVIAPQTSWTPEPPQAPVKEGLADLPGVKLYYWDTGGTGEPVIFCHANTGSAAVWGYQQPVLAKAGYRVIGYSRRGHYKSEKGDPANPGTFVGDFHALAQFLGLDRFHIVGSALGGYTPIDYALSHPDRPLSITLANTLGGMSEKAYLDDTAMLTGPGFNNMPADFRELSGSYRLLNPEGKKRWLELEHIARELPAINQGAVNQITWANVEKIKTPALLLTGEADLYAPPARLRQWASHIQNNEVAIFRECAHSAYWEQPIAFNATLIAFLRTSAPARPASSRRHTSCRSLAWPWWSCSLQRLEGITMLERLLDALREYKQTRSHEGRRRQMQYIGKLMRRTEADPIRAAVTAMQLGQRVSHAPCTKAERWRAELIADDEALTRFAAEHPATDLQQLRSVIRNARKLSNSFVGSVVAGHRYGGHCGAEDQSDDASVGAHVDPARVPPQLERPQRPPSSDERTEPEDDRGSTR